MEYGRRHHEDPHDRFDESRNCYFKLNEPARYEYQSLHLETLRLMWRILSTTIFYMMIFFVVLTKWVHEDVIENLL